MAKPRNHIRRSLRALTALLATALVCLVAAVPALALPANFWGVVPQAPPTAEEFHRLKEGGVGSIRIGILWAAVQGERGAGYNWTSIDPEIAGAVEAGLEVLPFLYGAPKWAVPAVSVPGTGGKVTAPQHLPVSGTAKAGWAAFLKAAIAHYGPGGSFWSEHPTLAVRPLRTWQIWNEENFKYFVARPNPVEYGKLVKSSYAAVKAADPGAKVLLGGMFARPKEATYKVKPPQAYFASKFLELMYKGNPGIRSKFNGVALHPYSTTWQRLTPAIEELRAVMKKNHDAAKGLWITELGWSSKPPSHSNEFAKGPQGQASQLKSAFTLLRNKQAKWRLQRVFWFSVDDRQASCNFCDGSGLFSEGFVPKPSWYAYVKFSGGTP
jgi:polysaccharide biosynthesis protein PslG